MLKDWATIKTHALIHSQNNVTKGATKLIRKRNKAIN